MNTKKVFQGIVIFLMVVLMVGTIYFSRITQQQQKSAPPIKAEEIAQPEYQPAQTDPNQWSEFVHPDYKYQLKYPQEFQVERRGRIGNIEDLVALNYVSGNKRLTVVKIQITSEVFGGQPSTVQNGKDNNNNEVIVFKKALDSSKTITIIGTVYPSTGSSYRFDGVIQKIIESLK